MVNIYFYDKKGNHVTVDADEGQTVMDAAVNANIPMPAICSGCLSCATCHVIVDKEFIDSVGKPSEDETDLLEFTESAVPDRSRLSCQIEVEKNIEGAKFLLPDYDIA